MAIDCLNLSTLESICAQAQPELLLSAVLHLMSQYNAQADQPGVRNALGSAIEQHFNTLAEIPTLAPVLRATCHQLAEHWSSIAERATAGAEQHGLLTRLTTGAGEYSA